MLICPKCQNKLSLYQKHRSFFTCRRCRSVLAYDRRALILAAGPLAVVGAGFLLNILTTDDAMLQMIINVFLAAVGVPAFVRCMNFFQTPKLRVYKRKKPSRENGKA